MRCRSDVLEGKKGKKGTWSEKKGTEKKCGREERRSKRLNNEIKTRSKLDILKG